MVLAETGVARDSGIIERDSRAKVFGFGEEVEIIVELGFWGLVFILFLFLALCGGHGWT